MHISDLMRRIRKKDTKPELFVRRLAHGMGYRFRLHRPDLPGTPDLVFPRLKKVVFVHGCFWHQHDCRLGRKQPATNTHYWLPKLRRNVERDAESRAALTAAGWSVEVIWECETRKALIAAERLRRFLDSPCACEQSGNRDQGAGRRSQLLQPSSGHRNG